MGSQERTAVPPPRTGPWRLSDLETIPRNGAAVFSCFHCGGGSTMGYKLAGYSVLGGVEIDPEMMRLYRRNHSPRLSFEMGVQEFKRLPDIPDELTRLDVLDGSPPCSTFSTAGSREKKWGRETHFREGQSAQRLDDLFFHFIEIADRLRPRVVVAENVRGLIVGNAKGYVKEIFAAFDRAGYHCQLFLLNASRMGVPQARERTFFLARRKDLGLPQIRLDFREPPIPIGRALRGRRGNGKPLTEAYLKWWKLTRPGYALSTVHPNQSFFNSKRLSPLTPAFTLASTMAGRMMHWSEPRSLSDDELLIVQSFPDDYDFCGLEPQYVLGMSVPPFMMQRVATEVWRQWLSRLAGAGPGWPAPFSE